MDANLLTKVLYFNIANVNLCFRTFDNTDRGLFRAQKVSVARSGFVCSKQNQCGIFFMKEKKNEMASYNLKLKLLFKAGFPLIYR